ncbi:ABC transporter ATP-binding protein [Ferroacidibacillus organovorans]|uniref:Bacitracin ABC transporter ATP-binding protein n=1 Tax=Ferroacidibacillus organovorans TaxID=1765683 RepID=A0A101XR18_9BACL|nr:ABC transporter ATP-binding protein [Ferroacidibacillus organovorans]KUO95948.1 bacitracin ABC transporter ATP-binding protein [Ferroacidibacillus organovorans]
MAEQAAVTLQNVTKRIGAKTLVDNLSLDIPAGEVFGFLGPNGAGKTTTIRMMVGLISMTQGKVLIKGHDVVREHRAALSQIGCIVENPELYKFLTGYQNLLHMARMTPGTSRARINEVVEMVGLQKRIHEKVKTYSLGMRQRLGLAQALLHRPAVLILDEPTNGLDPAGIRELRDMLRRLACEEGMSVIVSSHLLSEMELMCDRVAVIAQGKLIHVERVQELMAIGNEAQATVFDVADPGAALSYLREHLGDAFAMEVEGPKTVRIMLTRDQIPQIIETLVLGKIPLYGVQTQGKTLEDTFLQMTGDGVIA